MCNDPPIPLNAIHRRRLNCPNWTEQEDNAVTNPHKISVAITDRLNQSVTSNQSPTEKNKVPGYPEGTSATQKGPGRRLCCVTAICGQSNGYVISITILRMLRGSAVSLWYFTTENLEILDKARLQYAL